MTTSNSDTDKDNLFQEQREQASNFVEKIDNEYMNKFRALLETYINTLPTDHSEIAVGLNLSRTIVGAFMAGKRNDLPLSIGSICHLHKILTDTERVKFKRISSKKSDLESDKTPSIKKLRAEAVERRQKLRDRGPDELLITAGFQPRDMKMVPVSPKQYSQLTFISYLYKDRPLSQDLFSQITERELDRQEAIMREEDRELIKKESNQSSNKTSEKRDIPREELRSISWMNSGDKDEIEKQYSRAIKKLKNQDLTSYEKAGLLASVLNNQLNKSEEVNLRLRVARVERIPLSLTWETWQTQTLDKLWSKINDSRSECENQLLGLLEDKTENYPEHQVTRTIVTCFYDKSGSENKIDFECISTGTHSRTAISAIFLNLGIYNFMPIIKFDIRTFKEDVSSLIKASLIITLNFDESKESYIGEWTSPDLIQSIIQATIIASKKIVKQRIDANPITIDLYKEMIEKTSKLRREFFKYRTAFDGYDFNDGIINIQNFIDIEKDIETCTNKINLTEKKYLNKDVVTIWNNFLSGFYRIRVSSKIYRLTHENIKFNHESCKRLIEDIDRDLFDIEKNASCASKLLIPSRISLIAEKIAYNLSFGKSVHCTDFLGEPFDLLTDNINILALIRKIDNKVQIYLDEYITQNKPYNDPGYDIHHSLGSYYSITGRVLLYRASDEDEINSACDRLFKSIYYFYRIGLDRKIERNLTLIGRVKVRSKKDDYIQQCEKLSRTILEDNISKISAPIDKNFKLSMESRLNSLSGEYSFTIKGDKKSALQYALQALRGSLWLGLNRHIADNLYTIARSAKELEGIEIKEYLKKDFPQLYMKKDIENKVFINSPEQNSIAVEVISTLIDISNDSERIHWNDVWEDFRDASANIWNTWHRKATGDKKAKHPFAIQIKEMKFLEPIDRP